MRRSQAIQRLPVDSVLATLVLDDGERSDVLLFIPPGEDITRLLTPGLPFVPMIRSAQFCLVARAVIAALGVVGAAPADDSDLPTVKQRVRLRLRSKTLLEGELRWISLDGHKRTSDHANDPDCFLVLHTTNERGTAYTYYVAKSQIATIEEL